MNTKRFVMATLAVMVVIFAFDFIVHGILLKEAYIRTAELWRPEDEHNMPFMMLSQLLFAGFFTFLFTRNYQKKGVQEGVRYGLYVGALLASIELCKFCYMPVSFGLVFAWMASALIGCVLGGVVVASVYKK